MRVAVFGAGAFGLVAAHGLDDLGHEVTMFEAGAYASGHNTPTGSKIADATGRHVDTGFIVLHDREYLNGERLPHRVGVTS